MPGSGEREVREKAQSAPSGSLQHPGGGTVSNLTHVTSAVPRIQKKKCRESGECGIWRYSLVRERRASASELKPTGIMLWASGISGSRVSAWTTDPNFHGASCKKHVLAEVEQSSLLRLRG